MQFHIARGKITLLRDGEVVFVVVAEGTDTAECSRNLMASYREVQKVLANTQIQGIFYTHRERILKSKSTLRPRKTSGSFRLKLPPT